MLAFIKANYQIGDSIEVTCSEGLVSGQIEYVNSQFIVLRQPNGQIIGIAASNVKTFTAKSPVKLVPAQGETATQPPVNTEQDDANSNIEFTIETNEAESGNKNSSIVVENAEKADAPTTLRDVLDEKEVPSADELTGADPIAQPKVVGHIDLEHLQRIDPKIKRRSYFKPEETDITNEDVTLTESNDDTPSQPFVKAKGRISFYNTTKRFGFIHDFNSDADLYFYVQQVADHDLYEQLRRGLKVTYSIGQNNKGPMAEVVHLPRVVSEVIDMADAQIKARRYGLAKGLLQHVLEAYPDNREAIDMLDEVKLMAPEEKPVDLRNSLPSTTYAEAKKAYLNKEYDRAEQLYMQAIEAEEKVESSVKDLLTDRKSVV